MITFKPYPSYKPQTEGRKLCLVRTQDGSTEFRTLSFKKGEWQRMWSEEVVGFTDSTSESAINAMERAYSKK